MDKVGKRDGVIERYTHSETKKQKEKGTGREREEEHRKRKENRASEEQGVTPGLATLL